MCKKMDESIIFTKALAFLKFIFRRAYAWRKTVHNLVVAAGGGACSRLSRSVVSETSEKATAPSCGTRPCGPKMQVACAEFVAERLAGRGEGGGAARAGPLLLPFPSVDLGGGQAGRHRRSGLGARGRRVGVLAFTDAGQ